MSETLNNPPRTVEDTYTYDDSLRFRDLKGLLVLHKLLAISFLLFQGPYLCKCRGQTLFHEDPQLNTNP